MFWFYSKEKNSKLVGSLAYSKEDVEKYLNGNYFADCSQLNDENTVISEIKFNFPTYVNGELREKTDTELKLEGLRELGEGEYIENGELIKVEYDESLGYLKRAWNAETHSYYEGASDLEIVQDNFRKFEVLNTPADWEEMENEGVLQDWKNFRKENKLFIQRARQGLAFLINIPFPSTMLEKYLKKIKEQDLKSF